MASRDNFFRWQMKFCRPPKPPTNLRRFVLMSGTDAQHLHRHRCAPSRHMRGECFNLLLVYLRNELLNTLQIGASRTPNRQTKQTSARSFIFSWPSFQSSTLFALVAPHMETCEKWSTDYPSLLHRRPISQSR